MIIRLDEINHPPSQILQFVFTNIIPKKIFDTAHSHIFYMKKIITIYSFYIYIYILFIYNMYYKLHTIIFTTINILYKIKKFFKITVIHVQLLKNN